MMPMCKTVPPLAVEGMEKGIILDVRTPAEHRGLSLDRAHCHIPLDCLNVDQFVKDNQISNDHPVYILCRSGARATRAAEAFVTAGHSNVHVIEGGINACAENGVCVVRGDVSVLSLERQVRIVAGALVLVGIALGAFVAPVFYGVSGFVGAGLIFAGLTDWCGMGMLLARMPWNK